MQSICLYLIHCALAALAAYFSSRWYWWLPFLVYPIILATVIKTRSLVDPLYSNDYRAGDGPLGDLIMLQCIVWIIMCSVIGYKGFAAWWGIPLGIFFALNGCGLSAPLAWGRKNP